MTNEEKTQQLILDYRVTFGSEHGMRVLEDLKNHSTLNRAAVRKGQALDVNMLIYDEAQRAIVLYILGKIASPDDKEKQTEVITEKRIE